MNTKRLFFALLIIGMAIHADAQQTMDLSGTWQLSLDSVNPQFNDQVRLPGTLDMNGKGTPNQLTPRLQKPQLSRLTRRVEHIAPAWYRRTVDISADMAGRPLELRLERVLWKSRLYVDGTDTGLSQESLVAPHVYRLNEGLTAGRHTLTLMIDNRQQYDISVDQLAHAYTNDTQTKWNGVLGAMTLRALPDAYINKVEVYPDPTKREIMVRVDVGGEAVAARDVTLSVDGWAPKRCQLTPEAQLTYAMPGARLWSESDPQLYRLRVDIGSDVREVEFGMRSFAADGNQLTVNGAPVFLRGTLECCVFPLTGAPATDERGWLKTMETAREWGLNHLRFHSWCPPEAAFRVADRLGLYLQVELPVWSLTVGKDTATCRFLYDEFERIVSNYGNHPSLCIISCGNELQPDFDFLNRLTAHMRQRDGRHLYTTSSFTFEKGHGQHPEPQDQVFITQWTDHGWVRGQGVFDEHEPEFRSDFRKAARDVSVPLIAHEIGQYAVYPNLRETEKYTGTLLPLNFMAIRDDLQRKGLLTKADDYTQASGRLAALLYKEEIERAMKTPQQSGIQLLGLQDFPGQGTALVGLLDAFWDSKGLTEPSRFREFCAPVVPLARFDKAVWQSGETFEADVDVANFSGAPLVGKTLRWTIVDEMGHKMSEGSMKPAKIDVGRNEGAMHVNTQILHIKGAKKLDFIVEIEGTGYRNRWSIWAFGENAPADEGRLLVTQDVDEALKALKRGKRVLLSPPMERINGLEGKFLPVFWSPVHFPKQAGTMGLLIHNDHPALSDFPTDMHSDWQWWRLVKRSRVMVLDSLTSAPEPIVESVDNFVRNRRLAQVVEARVGKGRLLMSTIDLIGCDLPEARQLLYSLKRYMLTDDFAPRRQMTAADVRSLVLSEGTEQHTGASSIYE